MTKQLILISCLLQIFAGLLFAQEDIPGSKDHPFITRYPDSYITHYDVASFGEYNVATGPLKRDANYKKVVKNIPVTGKITRIQYMLSRQASAVEVYHNYKQAIEKAGFEILYTATGPDLSAAGGNYWVGETYTVINKSSRELTNRLASTANAAERRYIAARLSDEQGDIFITLLVNPARVKKDVFVITQLDIIEPKPMQTGLVKVDAETMYKSLRAKGKVAIYGILFEFDKAEIKSESEPVLSEIGKLLQTNATLNLYVVGHTDMKGTLAYNIELSKARANSVVQYLATRHGVAATRLTADGVGPLAPVATNETEEGREKNRRVELVVK